MVVQWPLYNDYLRMTIVRFFCLSTTSAVCRLTAFLFVPCGMPACATPRGPPHSSKGSLVCVVMYSYVCESFVFFPTFLFVRALFGKTLSTPTREARSDNWSKSGRDPCSVGRVAGAQNFLYAGADKSISRVSPMRPFMFHTCVPRLAYRYDLFGVFCTEHSPDKNSSSSQSIRTSS